jgi:fatty-acyl-CoA synthase
LVNIVDLFVRIFVDFIFNYENSVGIPDERVGEEVCAWIRLKPDQKMTIEEFHKFCEGKIAFFKIPKYIKFVEGFPVR